MRRKVGKCRLCRPQSLHPERRQTRCGRGKAGQVEGSGGVPVPVRMRIDLAKDRDRPARGMAMDVVMAMPDALDVRVVMMVKELVLDQWGKEKVGMNVGVRTALMVMVKRDDLRLGEKAQEP